MSDGKMGTVIGITDPDGDNPIYNIHGEDLYINILHSKLYLVERVEDDDKDEKTEAEKS